MVGFSPAFGDSPICMIKLRATHFLPLCAADKNSERWRSAQKDGWDAASLKALCREALASLRAAAGENLAAPFGRHAGTEAMAALAYQFAGLICAFHVLTLTTSEKTGFIGDWLWNVKPLSFPFLKKRYFASCLLCS